MCLALPMRILEINGDSARCDAQGITRNVSLFLLTGQQLVQGDYVLVHVGYAIQKIEQQLAEDAWRLWAAGASVGA